MTHKHVIKYFLASSEGRVGRKKRRQIEAHLKECDECREYFEKMSMLMERPDPSRLPGLVPDPFLPTRIRAMAAGETAPEGAPAPAGGLAPKLGLRFRRTAFGWLGVSLMGALTAVGIAVGLYLGKELSTLSTQANKYSENDIINAYYEAFSQSGFASDWESLIESKEEDSSET